MRRHSRHKPGGHKGEYRSSFSLFVEGDPGSGRRERGEEEGRKALAEFLFVHSFADE